MTKSTDYTLDSLITQISQHTKQAAEDTEAKGKDKEDKNKPENKSSDKKDDKDGKEGKDGKEKDQEKSASDLANEIMEQLNKSASTNNQTKGESQMNKSASAQELGKALAQQLLTKQAGIGDVNTTNGVTPGTVPNKVTQDNAAMVAQQDLIIQATPGTDGAGNGGTVNQIFDAIKNEGFSRGAVDARSQGDVAPAEGAQNATQAPAQVMIDESREKMAALQALVAGGVDFDKAVDLVKAASDDLEQEEETQIKQAALNELIAGGVDFDFAVKLINQFDKQ